MNYVFDHFRTGYDRVKLALSDCLIETGGAGIENQDGALNQRLSSLEINALLFQQLLVSAIPIGQKLDGVKNKVFQFSHFFNRQTGVVISDDMLVQVDSRLDGARAVRLV